MYGLVILRPSIKPSLTYLFFSLSPSAVIVRVCPRSFILTLGSCGAPSSIRFEAGVIG